ncbi:M28 family metallopeptidase [Nonomuraea sp. NPDC049152]|uniref:M28 family metallopeptidase n=1 Tax=Nonomuraea sp. NPDC049152 TaxID=3154350 RepID=UPI0033F79452
MIMHFLVALAVAAPGASLADDVTIDNVLSHLRAFQAIADAHGGTRAAGTPGYDASADYVAARLRAAGYTVERQVFRFDQYRELYPARLAVDGKDAGTIATLTYSANGDVTGRPRKVGTGCLNTDFGGFESGAIAVVDRGGCTFATKAANATAAGAGALVVVSPSGLFSGNAGVPQRIPVVGVDSATGATVARGRQVRVTTRTESSRYTTSNVIAQTKSGATDDVVMVGAHLDSVRQGPGINDNGSGSAALLEIALRMADYQPPRAVRFAWWGAEELGLLGSRHYVASLSPEDRAKIKMYLNFDMIASPNHTYGIYDGDDSDRVGSGPGPRGSAEIEQAFVRFFVGRRLPYTSADFSGRSDYRPFIEAGIPAGGLFTGAEAQKSPREAELFGGTAGAPMDPCYHQACDTMKNINTTALDVSADAIATVITEFAWRR